MLLWVAYRTAEVTSVNATHRNGNSEIKTFGWTPEASLFPPQLGYCIYSEGMKNNTIVTYENNSNNYARLLVTTAGSTHVGFGVIIQYTTRTERFDIPLSP